MVLPYAGEKVLLQSFEKDGTIVWDGFGSFYVNGDDPKKIAQKVFLDSFKQNLDLEALVERAKLKYFIRKPAELVDLDITIYFANLADTSLSIKNTEWFNSLSIPYDKMHVATGKWLPVLLQKPELLKASVRIDQPGDHTKGAVTGFEIE